MPWGLVTWGCKAEAGRFCLGGFCSKVILGGGTEVLIIGKLFLGGHAGLEIGAPGLLYPLFKWIGLGTLISSNDGMPDEFALWIWLEG